MANRAHNKTIELAKACFFDLILPFNKILIFSSRLRLSDGQSIGLMRNGAANFHRPRSVCFTGAADHFETLASKQIQNSDARA
jgi:hypothetical protein